MDTSGWFDIDLCICTPLLNTIEQYEESPEVQPDQEFAAYCHQQKSSGVSQFTTEKVESVIEI